jgi:hypothetical protein
VFVEKSVAIAMAITVKSKVGSKQSAGKERDSGLEN